jgi:hypothetical protein
MCTDVRHAGTEVGFISMTTRTTVARTIAMSARPRRYSNGMVAFACRLAMRGLFLVRISRLSNSAGREGLYV